MLNLKSNLKLNSLILFLTLSLITLSYGQEVEVIGKLKINDGTQGASKVLTSDLNGVASWTLISVPEYQKSPQYLFGNISAM